MAEHEHGSMDITEQEKTYRGFLRVVAILIVLTATVLLFLAAVGT